MKRSMTQIAYIAGILEKRGAIGPLDDADRSMVLTSRNESIARHINAIVNGRIRTQVRNGYKEYLVYLSTAESIGWFMTCYSFASPHTRDRFEHAVTDWRARGTKGKRFRPSACHPARPYYAKRKCRLCYERTLRGVLPINYRKRFEQGD